jgi:glyoxalase family protein
MAGRLIFGNAPGVWPVDKLIRSLHHVTATVTDAQEDLDFYVGLLGLRLVKQTVNFDNHSVYHFYYGNAAGTPGTIMTTFPYQGMGVPAGTRGAGQIGVTSFSVPHDALDFWRTRLRSHNVPVEAEGFRFGEEFLAVRDPSGLVIELVGTQHDPRDPWTSPSLSEPVAIRGVHSVTMVVRTPVTSMGFMQDVLGFEVVGEAEDRSRMAVNHNRPGHIIELYHGADAPDARNGLGTVHHVALAISDPEEQLRIRQELVRRNVKVTEVLDRQYFRSIYFREPGGVLFEIATIPPGFLVDEDLAHLGTSLKLPPWEEPHRSAIEASLPPITLRS